MLILPCGLAAYRYIQKKEVQQDSRNPLWQSRGKRYLFTITLIVLYCCVCYQAQQYGATLTELASTMIPAIFLFCVAMIDEVICKIPNFLIGAMLAARLCMLLIEVICGEENCLNEFGVDVVAMTVFFLAGLLVSILTKRGFGMGDVKLVGALALWVGIAGTFYTTMLAMFYCMLASIGMLLFRKKGLKDAIPFGPFIYFGYLTAVWLGMF